jgi:hypothetical protein
METFVRCDFENAIRAVADAGRKAYYSRWADNEHLVFDEAQNRIFRSDGESETAYLPTVDEITGGVWYIAVPIQPTDTASPGHVVTTSAQIRDAIIKRAGIGYVWLADEVADELGL